MDEVIIDGVSYIRIMGYQHKYSGDPSAFLNNFTEKERNEIRKNMMAHLVEAGYYERKDVWEKQRPKTYKQGSLFDEP
jgi:hypothetical protein